MASLHGKVAGKCLRFDWELAMAHKPLRKIPPLV